MPRYFFHVGHDHIRDVEGTDLPDFKRAQMEAVRLAGALLLECPLELCGDGGWYLKVADAAGLILFTVDVGCSLAPAMRLDQPSATPGAGVETPTAAPNGEIGAVQSKATPVILTTVEELEAWMRAPASEMARRQNQLG